VSSELPTHLRKLYKKLSASNQGEGLKTTFNLLNALKLNAEACNILHQHGVIEDTAIEFENGTIHLGSELGGRGSVLTLVFKHLVSVDPDAAQRFIRLCDVKTLTIILETDTYKFMTARLQGRSSSDRKAKHEVKLYIDTVRGIIREGPEACVEKLELFIRGCPPAAHDKLLKQLEGEVVSTACGLPHGIALATSIKQFQEADISAPWSRSDITTAELVLDISIAMSTVEHAEKKSEAKDERIDKFSFFEEKDVIALFERIERKLARKELDLSALIVNLCPGPKTAASHARFLGGLMRHLIQAAVDRKSGFDFRPFLSAVLLSNMPSRCAKEVASPPLLKTIERYGIAEDLLVSMEELTMEKLTIGQAAALGQLSTEFWHYASPLKPSGPLAPAEPSEDANPLARRFDNPYTTALAKRFNNIIRLCDEKIDELRKEIKLYQNLSEKYREAPAALKTAIELLIAVKLDAGACDIIEQNGVMGGIIRKLKAGHIMFDKTLSGQVGSLISVFRDLVSLDPQAAKRFIDLWTDCPLQILGQIEAYGKMQRSLQEHAANAKEAAPAERANVKQEKAKLVADASSDSKLQHLGGMEGAKEPDKQTLGAKMLLRGEITIEEFLKLQEGDSDLQAENVGIVVARLLAMRAPEELLKQMFIEAFSRIGHNPQLSYVLARDWYSSQSGSVLDVTIDLYEFLARLKENVNMEEPVWVKFFSQITGDIRNIGLSGEKMAGSINFAIGEMLIKNLK
jgi:hypothetical protein